MWTPSDRRSAAANSPCKPGFGLPVILFEGRDTPFLILRHYRASFRLAGCPTGCYAMRRNGGGHGQRVESLVSSQSLTALPTIAGHLKGFKRRLHQSAKAGCIDRTPAGAHRAIRPVKALKMLSGCGFVDEARRSDIHASLVGNWTSFAMYITAIF